MVATNDRDGRAAVDKAMSLLLAFGDDARTGIGVSELARRCDMSKSTAYRLLGMLTRNGVVAKSGPTYRLGAQLDALAMSADTPQHAILRDELTPFLIDLYEATRSTVHLAVLQGPDVVYLNKLFGHRAVAAPSRIGGRAPAHCTGVGKVLLAYDPAGRDEVLGTELRRVTPRTITDPTALGLELDAVRRAGIARDHGEVAPGLSCVAAPVLVRGTAVAALSVSGHQDRFDVSAIEPVLRRVCHVAGQSLTARRSLSKRPLRLAAISA